ncbi:substrate-binding domain-containing protein [Suipraeoptans intestinalis]|uniref:Phosphate ABC transporter substrate-binding protein n=1 Tax=Suipraeoptans intestinalis TaxID=2606628 RepID=A0A6N7UYG4_9FIRM|nr:substrate-binding domain-containing protein [Suipraeoptans intestinalis]MDD7770365.1 substrate-binding domain-containing protein [Suipraeoptans intestinalis]MSR93385.1 phosphate ABC transporter substrate-binding protein [Suipraeoptans intestinalis]
MKKYGKLVALIGLAAMLVAGCKGKGSDQKEAGNWDKEMDISVVSREEGSGTRGAFVELFEIEEEENGEKVDKTTDEAQITNSTSVMLTTVEEDEYAIGYVSLGALNDKVKAVKIDGAEATTDKVKSGDYPISRPFNLVVKEGETNPLVNDFIQFVLSEEGQKVVEENGYIPEDDAKPYEPGSVEGKLVVGGSSSVSPVMEKLAEAYEKKNTKVDVELQTTDSTTGVSSTIDGSYDIGMASRELKDSETSKGVETKVLATDGIAVIVNSSNPVTELKKEQVKDIFTGKAYTWSEVDE